MDFLQPTTWDEALAARAAHPDAVPLCGGTDVMVELNFDRRRPPALLDLTRVRELREWATEDGHLRLGAGVTYSRVIDELGDRLPGLAMASRTVGSPQIRNRGTVGGNLGAASPAGDAHPPLLAAGTRVEVASVRGTRLIPVDDFYTGVKRNALAPDELIRAVLVTPPSGPQQFSKIGTRNAMVIAVAAFGCRAAPRPQGRRHRDRLGRTDTAPGPRGRGVPRRGAGRAGPVGVARTAAARPGRRVRRAGARPPQHRSTTCAAARRTGCTRCPYGPPGGHLGLGRLPEGGLTCASRPRSTASAARPTTSGRARACSTSCASGWACPAPRTPASRASAARAPSTSTACPSAPAWSPPARRRAARSAPSRGCSDGDGPAPRPAGVRRGRRRAVRLLHPRPARRDPRPARPRAATRRLRDPGGARRQPVPLHRLREDPRRRAPGRAAAWPGRRRDRPPSSTARGRHMDAGRDEHAGGHVVVEGDRITAVGPGPAPAAVLPGATVRRRHRLPADARAWSTPTTTSTSG